MTDINLLNEHLIEELSELLNMESQLTQAIPEMAEASQSPELKAIMENYLLFSKAQGDRLLDIFKSIMQVPKLATCPTINELIQEGQENIYKKQSGQSLDIEMIRVALKMQEYEIAGYRITCDHAADLGQTMIVAAFNITLNEKRDVNFRLNELFQKLINNQAICSKGPDQKMNLEQEQSSKSRESGFYSPEKKFKRKIIKKKSKKPEISRLDKENKDDLQDI